MCCFALQHWNENKPLPQIEYRTNNFSCARRLRRHLQDDIVRDLSGSAAALQELEAEFNQLQEDREILRRIIPSGNSKVCAIFLGVSSIMDLALWPE